MILELHRQGVSVSAIARQVGLDRKTVHKYIERGLEPPMYGPRAPRASKDGARRCWKHTLGVTVVPIDDITENTVRNDSRFTNQSGMISITRIGSLMRFGRFTLIWAMAHKLGTLTRMRLQE